jgi:hypothetical protein
LPEEFDVIPGKKKNLSAGRNVLRTAGKHAPGVQQSERKPARLLALIFAKKGALTNAWAGGELV